MVYRKRVTIVLDVESEDPVNVSDPFIRIDLETEIGCCCNIYDLVSISSCDMSKTCSTCSDSYREYIGSEEKLHCMVKDAMVVYDDYCCDKWN